ncbi:rhomboid family intramembrane serine protease [Salinimonas sediminis]|uniref:Rhomboid family intramembrane serine protease n=1 Tax=Salinimonas sediminis TaxID=2303538 RepID=A0A346NP50_9ALTE|nr:rhomboid family intramembrane serine protease [Salinimonas sediminis]AXR07307.1 rhomboid family intramembrane serine protease [Salinimonas sediminis]
MNQLPRLKQQLRFLACIAAVLIILEIINLLTASGLNGLGILPRFVPGWWHIFTAPWVHGSPTHLATNLVPLMLFMWLTLQWGNKTFGWVTVTIFLLSGIGVWLLGRSAVHIGASGIVYGYFGFLLLAGFKTRKIPYIIISVLVAILYGGLLIGILPGKGFVSYEYHLFGFLAGLLAAWKWGATKTV